VNGDVSEPRRQLNLAKAEAGPPAKRARPASICPMTGVTIPECSCRRCVDEQIKTHAPWLLDRRFGNERGGPRAA
jgi:hypothetical protein